MSFLDVTSKFLCNLEIKLFFFIIISISCTLDTFLFLNHANENAALSTKQSSVLKVIIQLA